MFYRYELIMFDEPQGVGLFNGLYDANLSEKVRQNIMERFNELPLPPGNLPNCTCWFTEKGKETFKEALAYTKRNLKRKDCDLLELKMETIEENRVCYKDKFQIVYKNSAL